MDKIKFIDSLEFYQEGAFCKIDSQIEVDIMRKIYGQKFKFKDLMQGNETIFYRDTGGRYYDLYTSYSTTNSTTQKSFSTKNAKAMVALMSSNLFWWFRRVYADDRHSYIYEFERFKLPKFSKEIWQKLEKLGAEFEADIEAKANFTSTGTKEYRLRKSKHLIDQIDRLICPLYNLTHEEMDFIINYEVEFRTDQDK